MSRLSFATLLVLGLSLTFNPSASAAAVNCDVNKCIAVACKGKVGTSIQTCNQACQITIADRKKSGQCK
jgi:hypothetical protein